MKKSTLLFISILLFNCSEKKKDTIKHVKHNIEFLNRNLNIPENYISINFDDYQSIIKENYTDSIFVASKISQIENLKSKFHNYVMFCDKNNIENTLIIVEMINPQPNKIIKNKLARLIHSELKEKGKINNYSYKPMENRILNDWLIKIKGKKEYHDLGVSVYQTSYMASNFGVYVFNANKEMDFEKELTE